MSRLVCFDVGGTPTVLLQGRRYTVYVDPTRPALVRLRDEGTAELSMTRNELATLVAREDAALLDDLDEPAEEPEASEAVQARPRVHTDISHLSLHRILDWQAKLFLLVRLMPIAQASPKSSTFLKRVEEAHAELIAWRLNMGVQGEGKQWSPWTLYHNLLAWRKAGYAMAALQRKGVEYCPWVRRTSSLHTTAKELAHTIKLNNTALSASKVADAVNDELRKERRSGE